MQCRRRDWQRLFQLAQSEKDELQRNASCELARRIIHDRSLELAEEKMHHQVDSTAENNALDQALRDLWVLQNQPSQLFDSKRLPLRLVG